MDGSRAKRSITKRQRGKEYPTCNYKKVGKIYWSSLTYVLPYNTRS